MAKFESPGMADLIKEMERMGQESGAVAEAMVNAAVAVIRDEWQASAEAHDLKKTKALIDSIGFPAPIQKVGGILMRDVYPQGVDGKGVRNAEKAFVLNYGRHNMEPTYWVDEAEAAAGPKVQARLEQIWGEFLDTGKVPVVPDAGGSSGSGVTKTIKE